MRRAPAVRRRGCTDRGRCSRGRGARAAQLCDARPVGPSVGRDFGVCTVGREALRAGGQRRRRLALQEFSHECHRPRIVRYPRCNERNGCGPCARRDGCGALAGCQAPVWRVPMRSLVAAVVGGLMPGYGARLACGCKVGRVFQAGRVRQPAWLVVARRRVCRNAMDTRLRPLSAWKSSKSAKRAADALQTPTDPVTSSAPTRYISFPVCNVFSYHLGLSPSS